jgi:HK97 family phage portal protein
MNVFARKPAPAPVNSGTISISDPRFMARFGYGDSLAGVPVNEYTALSISALWRGSMLVSSSIAGLPLATMREWGSTRARTPSWLDDPGRPVGFNPFNWKQTSILHMILGGDSFQRHLYNVAGGLAGLEPINPSCVRSYWDDTRVGGKRHEVTLFRDNRRIVETHDASTMTQVMGPTLDGLRGLSVVGVARTSLGGAIAGDQAAAAAFRNGPMIGGLAVPTEDLDDGDAEKASAILNDEIGGTENAGKIVVLERKFDLKPWGMTLKDAQFLESRQFSIQEIARWLGVHPVFLMDPGAVSTWGTGVEILQRGLGRFTLPQWTDPFQEAMSDLLPNKSWAEFDFKALERGSPQEEIALIIQQIDGGLLTINQALALVNRSGIGPSGDVLRLHGVALNPDAGEQVSPTSAIPATGVAPTTAELHELLTGETR